MIPPLLVVPRTENELMDARSRMCSLPDPLTTSKLTWGNAQTVQRNEDAEKCLAFLCQLIHSMGLLDRSGTLTRERLSKSIRSLKGQVRLTFMHIVLYLMRTRNHKI